MHNNPLIYVDPSGKIVESDKVLPRETMKKIETLTDGWNDLQSQLLSLDNNKNNLWKIIKIKTLRGIIHFSAQNIRFDYFGSIVDPTQREIDAASSAGYYFGKNVDSGAGYKGRVDAQNDSTGTKRHGHIFGPKGEEWSRDIEGNIHDRKRNSPGSPPKWVQKEMEKKLRYKWKEAAQNPPAPSNNFIDSKDFETGVAVVTGRYIIYRGIRLLPSLVPVLWPTIPANLLAP